MSRSSLRPLDLELLEPHRAARDQLWPEPAQQLHQGQREPYGAITGVIALWPGAGPATPDLTKVASPAMLTVPNVRLLVVAVGIPQRSLRCSVLRRVDLVDLLECRLCLFLAP